MRFVLWVVLVVSGTLLVLLLGFGVWRACEVLRIRAGPGLRSTPFRLDPGSVGVWDPVCPAGFEWSAPGELWIETDPAWTDPQSFAVLAAVQPHEVCRPCGDFFGSPATWHTGGVTILPDTSQRARELDPRWSAPRCMDIEGGTRIEWTVIGANSDLAGREARLVLRFPASQAECATRALHDLTRFLLRPILWCATFVGLAAIGLRRGRRPRTVECVTT